MPAAPPERLSGRELYAVVLLGLTALFLFADQNLLAPNLTAIAREFGFSDLERDQKLGGDIALVFWILGGAITLLVGYLTDRLPRKGLFVGILMVGELPCFLTGFARDYDDLFWLRALTGIGIGGAMPLVYSMLGDLFSARGRAVATAVIGFAMGLGIALGQLAAGFLGPEYGWRLPFMLVAAPNFLLGPLFWFTVKEPRRGGREAALQDLGDAGHYSGRIAKGAYKRIFRVPTNILVFAQGIPGTVPWGVFFVFLNDYYAVDKGFSVQTATLIVMSIGGAAILGGLLGGLAGQKLYNRHPRYLPLLCGVTTLVGILPTLALLNYPSQVGLSGEPDPTMPLILGFLTGFTVTITSANVKAILLNVNGPETRGSVFSLYNLADDLGKGLGPAIIGLLIGLFGRAMAFNVATMAWVFCGLALLWMARTFPRDEAALQERLRREASGR